MSDVKKRNNYDQFGTEEEMNIDLNEFFNNFQFDDMMNMMMNDVYIIIIIINNVMIASSNRCFLRLENK